MANTRRARSPKPSGLRAALAAKQVRTARYNIPVVDSDTAREAGEALREANQYAFITSLGDNEDLQKQAAVAAENAKAKADACYYRITLKGISEADRDALRNEFPADDETKLQDDQFSYELLAASVVDSEVMTGDEWRKEMTDADKWTEADVVELLALAVDVNYRSFSAGIPKG